MFTIDIEQYLPKFILNDKNGYAIAMALQAGLQYFNDHLQTGVDLITDIETMPEWRLDELAWELNCLYDYHADIEVKRQWIIDAIPNYRIYGTPLALVRFVGAFFQQIELEENWEYDGGEPYHFRVTVEGDLTPNIAEGTLRAINLAKNVRSILDELRIASHNYLAYKGNGEQFPRALNEIGEVVNDTEYWRYRVAFHAMILFWDYIAYNGRMLYDGSILYNQKRRYALAFGIRYHLYFQFFKRYFYNGTGLYDGSFYYIPDGQVTYGLTGKVISRTAPYVLYDGSRLYDGSFTYKSFSREEILE